jgi:CBS domain-containing protein
MIPADPSARTTAARGSAATRCVRDLRLTPIVSVRPGTTLAAAARILHRTEAPFVLVEGRERVLARDDVVRALADDCFEPSTDVCELARSAVLVVGEAAPAIAVLGELVRGGASGAMVLDERSEPAGFLWMHDLVAALLDEIALLSELRHVLHVDSGPA